MEAGIYTCIHTYIHMTAVARQKKLWSSTVAIMAKENEELRQKEEEEDPDRDKDRHGHDHHGSDEESAEEKRREIQKMLERLEKEDEDARKLGFWGGLKKMVGWG